MLCTVLYFGHLFNECMIERSRPNLGVCVCLGGTKVYKSSQSTSVFVPVTFGLKMGPIGVTQPLRLSVQQLCMRHPLNGHVKLLVHM